MQTRELQIEGKRHQTKHQQTPTRPLPLHPLLPLPPLLLPCLLVQATRTCGQPREKNRRTHQRTWPQQRQSYLPIWIQKPHQLHQVSQELIAGTASSPPLSTRSRG